MKIETGETKKIQNRMIDHNYDGCPVECEYVLRLQIEYNTNGKPYQMCLWSDLKTGRSFQGCEEEGVEVN